MCVPSHPHPHPQARRQKITFRDQCVIAYGGLRGAIAFALAFILLDDQFVCTSDFDGTGNGGIVSAFPHRHLFVTTTIVIVMFTVFVQGTTIKPLLNALNIAKAEEHETAGFEKLNDRLVDYTMRGGSPGEKEGGGKFAVPCSMSVTCARATIGPLLCNVRAGCHHRVALAAPSLVHHAPLFP